MASVEDTIRDLANRYAADLQGKIEARTLEMAADDTSHFLIYQVLGISAEEGHLIDVYQNKGRFLYNAAGRFLEEATKLCFAARFPESGSVTIPNSRGSRPKTFGVDCLVNADAIEIKWRDATTDGDHITKEHTRISAIVDAGYRPVRVMLLPQSGAGHSHSGDAGNALHGDRRGVPLRRRSLGLCQPAHGHQSPGHS